VVALLGEQATLELSSSSASDGVASVAVALLLEEHGGWVVALFVEQATLER